MSIPSYSSYLSKAQALTATAASTNKFHFGADIDKGVGGHGICVEVLVTVAADITTGDETYQFDLRTDDNAAMSSPTILMRRIIPAATLVAGYRFVMDLGITNEAYIDLNYTLGGTSPSVTVTAFLTNRSEVASDPSVVYASGFSAG